MEETGLDEQDFRARGKPIPINFTPKWQGGSGRGSFDMGGMVDPLDEPIGNGSTRADWEAWKTSQTCVNRFGKPMQLIQQNIPSEIISGVDLQKRIQDQLDKDGPYPVWILNEDVEVQKPLATKKLDPRAHLPTRAYSSNGFDLKCIEGGEVKYGEITKFDTGIAMDLTGYALLIVPKSGLAVKHGIHVMAGLVDSDWRGSVQVCLTKLTPGSHIFRDGDKIAQFILIRTESPEIQEVAELPETQRGDKGFGSSGK